ncbi:MAG: hypothetical protein ACFHWZ_17615 [Phycisphaerales bacterium]
MIVFAFAGDSTITSFLPFTLPVDDDELFAFDFFVVDFLAVFFLVVFFLAMLV